jgi:hypothetical protein
MREVSGGWIYILRRVWAPVVGSMYQDMYGLWWLDTHTETRTDMGGWIHAPRRVWTLVVGYTH